MSDAPGRDVDATLSFCTGGRCVTIQAHYLIYPDRFLATYDGLPTVLGTPTTPALPMLQALMDHHFGNPTQGTQTGS